jgi:hypothetical protein
MDNLFEWVSGPYTAPLPPDYQDAYRMALEKQWHDDIAYIRAHGIDPPWQLEPDDLQQDEARLLSACEDNGGIKWADTRPDQCLTTTRGIGLTAIANAKAVIARCFDLGYITCVFNESGLATINATPFGMRMLEDYEDQKDAGIL